MNAQTAWIYGAADCSISDALPALAGFYADVVAAKAAGDAAGARTSLIIPEEAIDERPIRFDLAAAMVGSDGQTAEEDVYVLSKSWLDNTEGVLVEKVANLAWAAGSQSIASGVGGRASHVLADELSVTSTGVLEARTGKAIGSFEGVPAFATIYDVGPFLAILRVLKIGNASSIAALDRRWR